MLFTGVVCPNCQLDRNNPDRARLAELRAKVAERPVTATRTDSLGHTTELPLDSRTAKGLGRALAGAPLRRCHCGGVMGAVHVEEQTMNRI